MYVGQIKEYWIFLQIFYDCLNFKTISKGLHFDNSLSDKILILVGGYVSHPPTQAYVCMIHDASNPEKLIPKQCTQINL